MDMGFVGFGACVWFLSTFKPGDAMNKIDLIIDALEQADRQRRKQGYTEKYLQEALAAARELKALKPVAWFEMFEGGYVEVDTDAEGKPNTIRLYALDEAKHD
jgi:hypothetical protein